MRVQANKYKCKIFSKLVAEKFAQFENLTYLCNSISDKI